MIRTFLFLIIFLVAGCAISPKIVSSSLIQKHINFQSKYVATRNVEVWLPPNYDNDQHKRYAVLLMHDGQMLFDSTTTWNHQEWGADEVAERLIKSGKTEAFIIVGIWNTPLRFVEYLPQKPAMLFPDTLIQQVRNVVKADFQADNYLRFLTQELLPFIEKTYRVKSGKKNTFIAGSSMGGLISMYAICEYPEVFGGAACLSTHWPVGYNNDYPVLPNTLIDYFSDHLPDPQTHKLYFDYGTATLDSLYKSYQMRMDIQLWQGGYRQNKNWISREFPGADHSEKAWATRLEIPLLFLLGKEN